MHARTQVYDQHLDYLVLAPSLFSLAPSLSAASPSPSTSSSSALQPASQLADLRTTYEKLNDPRATEENIEDITDRVARGLFSVLVTMGTFPRSASLSPRKQTRAVRISPAHRHFPSALILTLFLSSGSKFLLPSRLHLPLSGHSHARAQANCPSSALRGATPPRWSLASSTRACGTTWRRRAGSTPFPDMGARDRLVVHVSRSRNCA